LILTFPEDKPSPVLKRKKNIQETLFFVEPFSINNRIERTANQCKFRKSVFRINKGKYAAKEQQAIQKGIHG
jgi:hypothetical protein